MIDFNLEFRFKHRSEARSHGGPRVPWWGKVAALGATILIVFVGSVILDLPASTLLGIKP